MAVQFKFCGIMRAADAQIAAEEGASYVGAIFAGGPRTVTPELAREIFAPVEGRLKRVGVFGAAPPSEIADAASRAELDVLQLHGSSDPESIQSLRGIFGGEIWAVVRTPDGILPEDIDELYEVADAVLLDKKIDRRLGGTGSPLDWQRVRSELDWKSPRRTVLAGGLTSANVAEAIRTVRPDIVDVSSGIESAPGIKNPLLMREFAIAVREADLF